MLASLKTLACRLGQKLAPLKHRHLGRQPTNQSDFDCCGRYGRPACKGVQRRSSLASSLAGRSHSHFGARARA